MADDFRKVRKEAEKQGWRIERTKKGVWKFYSPDGEGIVTVHNTPSDRRSLKNTISDLRRNGFKWEGC